MFEKLQLSECPREVVGGNEMIYKCFGDVFPFVAMEDSVACCHILCVKGFAIVHCPWSCCSSFTAREKVDYFDLFVGKCCAFCEELPFAVLDDF